MRIVAGAWRGQPLKQPPENITRPTTDRVRQALFSAIESRVDFEGLRVLDAFAGSGALGLEALSRGAAHATFCEVNGKVLHVLKANVAAMRGAAPRAIVMRADVLKLGHHGSSTSTGYSFFLAVSPDLAVASCGTDNEYGHPHYETLSLLYDTRTALYRTDCDGSITFLLDGTNVSVEPTRKELP